MTIYYVPQAAAGGGVTGTIAATQAADTAAASATVTDQASISATQAADTAAVGATVTDRASIAATQGADVAAVGATVTQPVTGTIAATQAADTAAVGAAVAIPVTGTFAVTQAADVSRVSVRVAVTAPATPKMPPPPVNTPVDRQGGALSFSWMQWFQRLYSQVTLDSYGNFSDTTTQAIAVVNTPQALTLNTTNSASGIYIGTPTSRVYAPVSGLFNVQFSLQLLSSTSAVQTLSVWYRINGLDVANSATVISINSNTASVVPAWNFFVDMQSGDYFELIVSGTSTNLSIAAVAAQTVPYVRPAIPSVILTVSRIPK